MEDIGALYLEIDVENNANFEKCLTLATEESIKTTIRVDPSHSSVFPISSDKWVPSESANSCQILSCETKFRVGLIKQLLIELNFKKKLPLSSET